MLLLHRFNLNFQFLILCFFTFYLGKCNRDLSLQYFLLLLVLGFERINLYLLSLFIALIRICGRSCLFRGLKLRCQVFNDGFLSVKLFLELGCGGLGLFDYFGVLSLLQQIFFRLFAHF